MKTYVLNLAYALDLLANAIFGGERHETISARWGKIGKKVRLWYWGCKFLDFVTRTEHCKEAHEKYAKMREAIK